ncbi:MAG: glycosyltransferase family 39 protein [Paralcaligenes sp.]
MFGDVAHKKQSWPLALYVLLFLVGMVALWSILCGISHKSPDLDNMEELVWASSFEWGYYKHPPVPAWFMYGLTSLFGKPIWLTFFAGQLFSAIALWFVWLLGCEFTTPRRAFIAMLLVSVTAYFSVRATVYNHNSVQLWSVVASTWLFYRALRYQKTLDWLWLGAACGMAFITKYSALIQFAAFFVFFVRQRHYRQAGALKGVLWALLTFSIVISPHVYWLFQHSFEPLYYADQSIDPLQADFSSLKDIWGFSTTQLGRLAPMFVAWLALIYWDRRRRKAGEEEAGAVTIRTRYSTLLSAWDRSFLLVVGFSPFVLTVLVSAALGTALGASWASTFFVLFGFYAFWWLSGDEALQLRRTAIIVVAIQVLMACGYALGRGPLGYYTGRKTDSTFPGATISQKMQNIWREHVPGVPLTLVASDTWLGGNIAVHVKPAANVFIDGSLQESPWLKSTDVMSCGMLVAYSKTTDGNEPSPRIQKLYDQATFKGVVQQRWSTAKSPLIVIDWGIITPKASCPTAARRP